MLWKGASVHWVEISFASERNPESKLAIQMPKIDGISESLDLCIVALCVYRVKVAEIPAPILDNTCAESGKHGIHTQRRALRGI